MNHKKLCLISMGCARNQVDSEIMLGKLAKAGWEITQEPEEANVIVVNTCSFIEDAANESIDTILELAEFKQTGECERLIVTGCLPERFREDTVEALPEVDIFLGTGAFDQIVRAAGDENQKSEISRNRVFSKNPVSRSSIKNQKSKIKNQKSLLPDPDTIPISSENEPRLLTIPHMAYLKIAEGCSRHCTYCIIPKLRGKQKSFPLERILNEAASLISSGVRELTLVAQDTTAYGKDLTSPVNLQTLLDRLADISDDVWFRILYGHPESLDMGVVRTIAAQKNICSYFDIPIQHASTRMLKQMGRNHTRQYLYELFENIRAADAEAALRTTVIVGFPGETDKDFEELLQFVDTIRFDHLGVFIYSDSEDLPSHRLSNHVPQSVAQKRYDRLMSRQAEISLENNQKYIGKSLKVLVEETSEPGLFWGRTAFQAPEVDGITFIHADRLEIGDFAEVNITDALEYDLIGEIDDQSET